MKNVRLQAMINIFAVCCAYIWFIFVDFSLLYGPTFGDRSMTYWSFFSPQINTYKFWHLTSFALITMTFMHWKAVSGDTVNPFFEKRILSASQLIVVNQFFLALSIYLKAHHIWMLSLLCSLIALVSLLLINKKFEINRRADDCITQYITRKTLGLYTGWLSYVIAYNAITTSMNQTWITTANSIFIACLIALAILTIWIIYYALLHHLVSVSIGACFGLLGTFFQANNPNFDQSLVQIMHYSILFSILLCGSTGLYVMLRPKKVVADGTVS